MKRLPILRCLLAALFVAAFCAASPLSASDDPDSSSPTIAGLYVKVLVGGPLKLSKLQPGERVKGTLARDVYSDDQELFAAGERVELTVDHLEKRRRVPNDHWPWVVKAFTPRHEFYPVFKTASVFPPGAVASTDGQTLQVSLISVSRKREVHAQPKKKRANPQEPGVSAADTTTSSDSLTTKNTGKTTLLLTMVLEAATPDVPKSGSAPWSEETLPAGTACKIILLSSISASKSKPGDTLKARLVEPVRLNSRVVLPAGSLFEGSVVRKTPPRWLSRAGTLSLAFTGITLPDGDKVPLSASLMGAELDQRSHTRIDSEGQLHGERPGTIWMAINLGVTAGLSKEMDDATQLLVEAIVSTATDISTAGTARIVGGCISGFFMVSRHGRDVVLPRFTEMDISLDRPLSLTKVVNAGPLLNVHGN